MDLLILAEPSRIIVEEYVKGENIWLYKFANGGVGGTPLGQIQPVLWVILFIEGILFVLLAVYYKKKS